MAYTEYKGEYTSTKFRTNTIYSYRIYVPQVETDKPFALLVTHDGLNEGEAVAMAKLAETGEAPYCVIIGLGGEYMKPTRDGAYARGMRFNDYDIYAPEYVNFIIEDFIPYATEKYGLNFSDNPDMHMISGGSSGGISAWNGVWFRNDYFRRVYMSSPTFSAMARGNMLPVQIRLFETKPVRAYIDWSENEPDDYFGSSYCAALEGKMALEFAGYDYQWEYHPGEGHCSRATDPEFAEKRMRFIWKDWETEPIKVLRLSKRADQIIFADEPWGETDSFVPNTMKATVPQGEYKIKDNAVVFCADGKEKIVADGFSSLTSVSVSSDLWRLYIADSLRRVIYVGSIQENGDVTDIKTLASLQTYTDFRYPGATDICGDRYDRVYAATEMGIQCVRSYGLVELILPLPGNIVPLRVALKGDVLYADCGEKIFCRKIKLSEKDDHFVFEEPKFTGYY